MNILDDQREPEEVAFDPVSEIFLGRRTHADDGPLSEAIEEFFFPRYLGGKTWSNLRDRCYPSFLDVIYDLVPEEQRFLCMNQWLYQECYTNHVGSPEAVVGTEEDTFGLKDKFVTILSEIFEHARDQGGFIESGWIAELLQVHLTGLVDHMVRKFPAGPHFFTGNINYTRIASNLRHIEHIDWHVMHESDYYRVGRNGVREMVPVSDPADPLPPTVMGGVLIYDFLLELEKFSADPSHGGQFSVEPRAPGVAVAWSVHDSSSTLPVHEGPGESIVSDHYWFHGRVGGPVSEAAPSPDVPVPTLSKYVEYEKVVIADSSSQVSGSKSVKSTGETVNLRTVLKLPRVVPHNPRGTSLNTGANTNTVGYVFDGSGTGSLVNLNLNPEDYRDSSDDYTSDASTNPAGQYLTHDMKYADIAVAATLPDPEDLATFAKYGHFADYHATSFTAVEETGVWSSAHPSAAPDADMPSPEAQEMYERIQAWVQSEHFNHRTLLLGPISYLLGTLIHTEFEVTSDEMIVTERLQNNLTLPVRSPPRESWHYEVRTIFQALLTTNHRTREADDPSKLVPIKTMMDASVHNPFLLGFWVINRSHDPEIPNYESCQMTRFPILTPDRNISAQAYADIVTAMASNDPRVKEMVTLEMIEARDLYERLESTYKSEQFNFIYHVLRCTRRCLERHGRIWCHDGRNPSILGVTCAAIKHAHGTRVVHVAFPQPPQAVGEKPDAYQTRIGALVNPVFPGCFHPEFITFSGGVCTSLRSKRVVGRYLRVVHGKGTGGANNFRKGFRQMESSSLCLLLTPPVDTMFNGYTPLDVTTIRPFGLRLLDHLLVDTQARTCTAYKGQQTTISKLCASYLSDVTFCMLFFTNRNVAHFTEFKHLKQAQTRLRERFRQAFCSECKLPECFVNMHMVRTILIHLFYTNELVQEYGLPHVKVHHILGGDFRPHFLRTYCEEVPREAVPQKIFERYGGDVDGKFYRVNTPPSMVLVDEPARTIPAYTIPAQPERNIPEKRVPPQYLRATREVLEHMWGRQIFPACLL